MHKLAVIQIVSLEKEKIYELEENAKDSEDYLDCRRPQLFFMDDHLNECNRVENDLLKSDSMVIVEKNDDFISFTPTASYQKVVIFYPAALVDLRAYAPLARKIAENGVQATMIRMPWRMTTIGYDKIN